MTTPTKPRKPVPPALAAAGKITMQAIQQRRREWTRAILNVITYMTGSGISTTDTATYLNQRNVRRWRGNRPWDCHAVSKLLRDAVRMKPTKNTNTEQTP